MTLKAKAKRVLTGWHAARPTLALMGEFSAGKSTLLNVMLGQDHLPTKVTATALPSVWVTYSETPFTQALRHDGTLEDVDLTELGEDARADYLLLRMGLDADVLKRTDIIDTPGISDPKLAKGATRFLQPFLDGVLWLSPANQAWRQTERAVWEAFSTALSDKSLMVVTRADTMRKPTDLEKVMRRVRRETDGLFANHVALASLRAAEAQWMADDAGWEASGGALFKVELDALLDKVEAARAAAPPKAKPAKAKGARKGASAAKPKRKAPARKPATKKPAAKKEAAKPNARKSPAKRTPRKSVRKISALAFFDEGLKALSGAETLQAIEAQCAGMAAQLEEHAGLDPAQRSVLAQSLKAEGAEDAARLAAQIKAELAEFDEKVWYPLAA